MKKSFKTLIAILLLVPCLFVFSSCFGTDGKSAYELAKENGFTGTEIEWLESLRGESGSGVQSAPINHINKNLLSVVSINASFASGTSAGAGVIIKSDKSEGNAYIITNYHVVYGEAPISKISTDIEVFLYGQEYSDLAISVSYVGGSMINDIAVLKIQNSEVYKKSSAIAAEIDRSQIYVGDSVVAIGNPAGLSIAATKGMVSVESQNISLTLADGVTSGTLRVVRVDAAVNGGNSGGGLFNQDGKLVGIVNAKMLDTATENIENIGYAIPISVAYGVASNIMAQETPANSGSIKVLSCKLGVEIKMNGSVSKFDEVIQRTVITETLVVNSVVAGGASVGQLQAGDVIQSFIFEGKTLAASRLFTISDYLLYFDKSDIFHMTVLRNGEPVVVNITLNNATIID